MNPKLLQRLQKLEPSEAPRLGRVVVIKVREGMEYEDAAMLHVEMAEAGHPVLPQDMVVQIRVLNWPKNGAPLPESCRGIISWGNGWGKAA